MIRSACFCLFLFVVCFQMYNELITSPASLEVFANSIFTFTGVKPLKTRTNSLVLNQTTFAFLEKPGDAFIVGLWSLSLLLYKLWLSDTSWGVLYVLHWWISAVEMDVIQNLSRQTVRFLFSCPVFCWETSGPRFFLDWNQTISVTCQWFNLS